MTHRLCFLLNLMDLEDMQGLIHTNVTCIPTQCISKSHDAHSSAGKEPRASWARLVHYGWASQAAGTPQEGVDFVSSLGKPTRAEYFNGGKLTKWALKAAKHRSKVFFVYNKIKCIFSLKTKGINKSMITFFGWALLLLLVRLYSADNLEQFSFSIKHLARYLVWSWSSEIVVLTSMIPDHIPTSCLRTSLLLAAGWVLAKAQLLLREIQIVLMTSFVP